MKKLIFACVLASFAFVGCKSNKPAEASAAEAAATEEVATADTTACPEAATCDTAACEKAAATK